MAEMTAAIFDMDGTILDSGAMWGEVSPMVLRRMGVEPRESIRQDMLPLGMREFAPTLKRDYGLSRPVEEIAAEIEEIVHRYYTEEAQLKPGALDFLKTLKAAGVRLALATATDRNLVEPALRLTGAWELFDAVYTCGEVGKSKNDPLIYRLAAGASPKETTWVFEDALYAIETARADGFPICAVADKETAFQWDEIRAAATCALDCFADWREMPFASALTAENAV